MSVVEITLEKPRRKAMQPNNELSAASFSSSLGTDSCLSLSAREEVGLCLGAVFMLKNLSFQTKIPLSLVRCLEELHISCSPRGVRSGSGMVPTILRLFSFSVFLLVPSEPFGYTGIC